MRYKNRLFTKFNSEQGLYNPLTRGVENELLPCLQRLGIRFYAYNLTCGGILTGKHKFEDVKNAQLKSKCILRTFH